jgi:hypothetical protein
MKKKKTSSIGIRNSVGPRTASGGYDQMFVWIRYESHGIVDTIATVMRKHIIYLSSPVASGRKSNVRAIAGGIVNHT